MPKLLLTPFKIIVETYIRFHLELSFRRNDDRPDDTSLEKLQMHETETITITDELFTLDGYRNVSYITRT